MITTVIFVVYLKKISLIWRSPILIATLFFYYDIKYKYFKSYLKKYVLTF